MDKPLAHLALIHKGNKPIKPIWAKYLAGGLVLSVKLPKHIKSWAQVTHFMATPYLIRGSISVFL